ncbi:MAG: valine--tRNA ligase [Treponema sp.]|nr:valine--tRNA ligase [Treponema sp.]
MKSIELNKSYDPKSFEDRIYALWKESGAFSPDSNKDNNEPPFVIVIPPPNVTGVLHLGHGLNNSLQDIIVRFHRMRGAPALWVPGTDHAGIATQNVVERKLKAQGKSRRELGREKFLEETWKVKNEHHAIITKQLEKIGASVDWKRERFTMDEGLSRAVREVFVTLYERDLLYKGNYLVNWCTSCGTALSDDEVEHEETTGKMYRIRYFLTGDKEKYIEIATTRPETLFGDTAVTVNPEDERYTHLKGVTFRLPLTERDIPLVFDSYVDKTFGTGALKTTPAHDTNDWELGKKHNLPVINILNSDGTLNNEVPEKYRGLPVLKARQIVLEDLKSGGWLAHEDAINHSTGRCYRCNTVIEPFLSEQWFVRMKPLAEKALACWQRGEIIFYPKKWENTYKHWMENIRDWCVSRQLWWGHRIPAWTCQSCGKLTVSRNDLKTCPDCGSANIEQDSDVLDTWFSSWLWPFSTLGWVGNMNTLEQGSRESGIGNRDCCPKENIESNTSCPQSSLPTPHSPLPTPDLDRYYPTTALITAYEIIFFWVARMIMAGLEFTGKAPFRDIFIHGLVRDKQGRKMSKSLGNGLDPLELVDEFGADAMKFTLAFLCAQGHDVLADKDSFKLGSRFANKVWNASRYILMNLEGRKIIENPQLISADKWIYSRLNNAAKKISEAFLSYNFYDAAQTSYEYFWNDFCDWYVEATKLSTKSGDEAEKDRSTTVLLDVLAQSLKLLHPLLPFVTEEIYQKLPIVQTTDYKEQKTKLLICAKYPVYDEKLYDARAERDFAALQSLTTMARTLRSECGITPDKKLRVMVRAGAETEKPFKENEGLIKLLGGIGELSVENASVAAERPAGSIGIAGNGFEVFVFVAEAVDTAALRKKFSNDLERDQKYIEGLRAKLSNEQFINNAPQQLVAEQRAKLEEAIRRTEKFTDYFNSLAGNNDGH